MNKQEFLEQFKKELEALNEVESDSPIIEILKHQAYSIFKHQLPDDFSVEDSTLFFSTLREKIKTQFKTDDSYQEITSPLQKEINYINKINNSGSNSYE